MAINLLNENWKRYHSFSSFIFHICFRLRKELTIDCPYVPMEANRVADCLAGESHEWSLGLPVLIVAPLGCREFFPMTFPELLSCICPRLRLFLFLASSLLHILTSNLIYY